MVAVANTVAPEGDEVASVNGVAARRGALVAVANTVVPDGDEVAFVRG